MNEPTKNVRDVAEKMKGDYEYRFHPVNNCLYRRGTSSKLVQYWTGAEWADSSFSLEELAPFTLAFTLAFGGLTLGSAAYGSFGVMSLMNWSRVRRLTR
jgi:hypothetical protein